jgi:hypothetical protein
LTASRGVSSLGIVIHKDFIIRYANPVLVTLFGYERTGEVIGRDLRRVLAPSDRPRKASRADTAIRWHPPRGGSRLLPMAAFVTAALLAALLLIPTAGPAEDRPPASGERFTLVEHVQVVGSCFEDHVGEPATYAGFIDQWRDGKKNQDLLHGSVANFDRPNAAAPTKYHPPAAIQFGEVGADQLAGSRLVLKGLTSGDRPRAATCTLEVRKRERPARAGAIPVTARHALSGVALVIGVVAGVRLTRQQVRHTAAPLLLGLAFLLQLVCLLLP